MNPQLSNDFYTVHLTTGEVLECYYTSSGLQSLDGSGRVIELADTIYISRFDDEGSLQVLQLERVYEEK